MHDSEQVKLAKAKLYNLKSATEGTVTMMMNGILSPDQAMEGIAVVASKAAAEYFAAVERANANDPPRGLDSEPT